MNLVRRDFFWSLSFPVSLAAAQSADPLTPPDTFPSHPLALAREVVGVSHANLKRLKELVDAQPALARAAVDWGFGDWEDALGAASHVGNRDIAEYLISKGARPTIFSATMLGQLDVVKAFVAAQPGIQRIPGPHSISLLAHAKSGGKQAEAVYEYLQSLGDAGSPAPPVLSPEDIKTISGTYVYGSKPNERIAVAERNGSMWLTKQGLSGNRMIHLGDRTFHPAGSREVRVRFAGEGPNMTLTIHDPGPIVIAKRA